jgi:hypothetical protein
VETELSEWQLGWRDARWGFYFSLALLPCVPLAVLLAYAIEGPAALDPSPLTWVLCLPATGAALTWAGYKDGFNSLLGTYVWALILFFRGWFILRDMVRTEQLTRDVDLRIAERRFTFTLSLTIEDESPSEFSKSRPWRAAWGGAWRIRPSL